MSCSERKRMNTQNTAKTQSKQRLIILCESAMMIALAAALSFVKIKLWGNGGSVDLVMIPIILLAYRRGAAWAIPAGLIFGLIKCLIGEGFGYGAISVLLDYVLAYGVVGVAGFFPRNAKGLAIGTAVASLCRFGVHFLSGVTIWKLAVGESVDLFGAVYTGDTAVLYSVVYNGSYMLFNAIIAIAGVLLLKKAIDRIPK